MRCALISITWVAFGSNFYNVHGTMDWIKERELRFLISLPCMEFKDMGMALTCQIFIKARSNSCIYLCNGRLFTHKRDISMYERGWVAGDGCPSKFFLKLLSYPHWSHTVVGSSINVIKVSVMLEWFEGLYPKKLRCFCFPSGLLFCKRFFNFCWYSYVLWSWKYQRV